MKEFNKNYYIGLAPESASLAAKEMGLTNIRFIMGHYKMDYQAGRINFEMDQMGLVNNAWIG